MQKSINFGAVKKCTKDSLKKLETLEKNLKILEKFMKEFIATKFS